jgi:hypothetical protein
MLILGTDYAYPLLPYSDYFFVVKYIRYRFAQLPTRLITPQIALDKPLLVKVFASH